MRIGIEGDGKSGKSALRDGIDGRREEFVGKRTSKMRKNRRFEEEAKIKRINQRLSDHRINIMNKTSSEEEAKTELTNIRLDIMGDVVEELGIIDRRESTSIRDEKGGIIFGEIEDIRGDFVDSGNEREEFGEIEVATNERMSDRIGRRERMERLKRGDVDGEDRIIRTRLWMTFKEATKIRTRTHGILSHVELDKEHTTRITWKNRHRMESVGIFDCVEFFVVIIKMATKSAFHRKFVNQSELMEAEFSDKFIDCTLHIIIATAMVQTRTTERRLRQLTHVTRRVAAGTAITAGCIDHTYDRKRLRNTTK